MKEKLEALAVDWDVNLSFDEAVGWTLNLICRDDGSEFRYIGALESIVARAMAGETPDTLRV
jgi:hypothetical protein